jgi:hypothetical protein
MKGLFTQTLLALIYWPWAKLKEFLSGLFSDDAEQASEARQGKVSGDGSGRPLRRLLRRSGSMIRRPSARKTSPSPGTPLPRTQSCTRPASPT